MAMNNARFEAIMREYDKLQLQHQYELNKRFEEVYAKTFHTESALVRLLVQPPTAESISMVT